MLNFKLNNEAKIQEGCNYRQPQSCPLYGKCYAKLQHSFKPTVSLVPDQSQHHYIGLTSETFQKKKILQTQKLFCTKHSQHKAFWVYQNTQKKKKKISFKQIGLLKPLQPKFQTCNLCLTDSFEIMKAFKLNSQTLNKRYEIFNKCPHREKHLLTNYKWRVTYTKQYSII